MLDSYWVMLRRDIEKNETMKFTTKQKDLEKVILRKATWNNEDKHHIFSVTVKVSVKSSYMCFNCNTNMVHEITKMPWGWL